MERGEFVAREQELEHLDSFLNQALNSQGTVCFVTGGAGTGKTSLVYEFSRRVQERHDGLIIVVGQSDAQTGVGDAYLPFREVLSQLTGDVEAELTRGVITKENANRLRGLMRLSGQALVEVGPDLVGIFVPGAGLAMKAGGFVADKAGWLDKLEQLAGRSKTREGDWRTGIEQSHIFEQYTNVLKKISEKQPLLLVLDDLQWADAASIGLLFRLGRRIGNSRIMIVGTYRPEEVAIGRAGERHPIEKVLAEFKRYYGDIFVDLDSAEKEESRYFVDAFLDLEPNILGEGFRQAFVNHTGGHPLFTRELLRDMQDRGDLVQDEAGRWVESPLLGWTELPPRVEGVIEERIDRLENELRQSLTVGSVEGEQFTAEVVARVQAIDVRGLIQDLSGELQKQHRLVSAQSVRRLNSNGQRLSLYRFQHNLFQQYLYSELDEVERVCLHEDVGTMLEELYGDQVDDVAVQLARHFGEAGLVEKAVKYFQLAGEQALTSFANIEAESYFRRVLNITSSKEDQAKIFMGLGEALFNQSRYEEAIQVWQEGISLFKKIGNLDGVARLYARSARAASCGDEYPECLWLSQKGLEVVEGIPESPAKASLIHEAARANAINGLPEEAEKLCRQALEIAERLGAVDVQADALATLGSLPNISHDEALGSLARGIELAESNGLLEIAGRAHHTYGFTIRAQFGDHHASRNHFLRAVEIYRQLGAAILESLSLVCAAYISINLGDIKFVEETLAVVEQLKLSLAISDQIKMYLHYLNYILHFMRGELTEALQIQRVGRSDAQQRGDLQKLYYISVDMAETLLALDRIDGIDDWAEAQDALADAISIVECGVMDNVRAYCLFSIVRTRQGNLPEAGKMLSTVRSNMGSSPTFWDKLHLSIGERELATAEKRWTHAVNVSEIVIDQVAGQDLVFYWAFALFELAEIHIARGEYTDQERAKVLYYEALAMFQEMGNNYYANYIEERVHGLQ